MIVRKASRGTRAVRTVALGLSIGYVAVLIAAAYFLFTWGVRTPATGPEADWHNFDAAFYKACALVVLGYASAFVFAVWRWWHGATPRWAASLALVVAIIIALWWLVGRSDLPAKPLFVFGLASGIAMLVARGYTPQVSGSQGAMFSPQDAER